MKSFRDFLSVARLPYPDKVQSTEAAARRMQNELAARHFLFISKMILPNLGGFVEKEASLAAQLRSAKIALAIERHRLAQGGAMPKALDELAPQYLESLPKDTFQPEPLEFEQLEKGYRIISLAATERRGPGTKKNPRAPVGFAVTR
jgi:hypothetical protein